MDKEELINWINKTKELNYIDCCPKDYDGEYEYIIQIAEELLKRLD